MPSDNRDYPSATVPQGPLFSVIFSTTKHNYVIIITKTKQPPTKIGSCLVYLSWWDINQIKLRIICLYYLLGHQWHSSLGYLLDVLNEGYQQDYQQQTASNLIVFMFFPKAVSLTP
ncbi:hypothetical protein B738_27857 [Photorhabdus temperata subsp. temperata M1021]|nr:hypothetical protein B738_27857 [Photorhabdus temperata subsp. temperata M1021]